MHAQLSGGHRRNELRAQTGAHYQRQQLLHRLRDLRGRVPDGSADVRAPASGTGGTSADRDTLDTRRAQRVPLGQARTREWPVLDASGAPDMALDRWKFHLSGRVGRPVEWNWEEFQKLARVKVFSDFHCMTRWSRLGNLWEGVSNRELLEHAGGALPDAQYAPASAN